MSLLGFGTMNLFDKNECAKVLKDAYEAGYRLFDCAQIYGNEDVVGYALKEAKIPREEIFLTTKGWFTNFEGEDVRKSIKESMEKLQTSYLDWVLIHRSYGNVYHAYRELEKMVEEGLIKNIGISNYQDSQYIDLIHFNKIVPVLNQIKVIMKCQRKQMQERMKKHGTLLQEYQVFGKEETLPFYENEQVKQIALKYGKTTRQIVMKYLVQNDISVISRLMEKAWMKENLDLFDFELNDQEMEYLAIFDDPKYNTRSSQ